MCYPNDYTEIEKRLEKAGFEISENPTHIFMDLCLKDRNIHFVTSDGTSIFIKPDDITLIESFDSTVTVHTKNESIKVKQKLFELEKLVICYDCVRINKSQIIPTNRIVKISPQFNSKLRITFIQLSIHIRQDLLTSLVFFMTLFGNNNMTFLLL
jgi:DNA-binding LytR/AlgR family response regulator